MEDCVQLRRTESVSSTKTDSSFNIFVAVKEVLLLAAGPQVMEKVCSFFPAAPGSLAFTEKNIQRIFSCAAHLLVNEYGYSAYLDPIGCLNKYYEKRQSKEWVDNSEAIKTIEGMIYGQVE